MPKAVLIVLALIALLTGTLQVAAYRWHRNTQEFRTRLEAARRPIQPATLTFQELAGLPAPVQRYFRTVLKEGQPFVATLHLRHEGTFNMGETADQWKPFTSDQQVITQRPGFDWDGRIVMTAGLPVRVHDAYAAGEGILHASFLGLITVADLHGPGDIAEGELMRFFAEAAWYPTALLPSQGVHWQPVDDRSAQATLTDGRTTVTLLFTFNEQGLIDTVRANARGRTVSGKIVPTPWQGRFWNYEDRSGMKIPTEGEVAWILPEGPKPYWRGHLTGLTYEFAPAQNSAQP